MMHILRPYKFAGIILLAGSGALLSPVRVAAQAAQLVQFIQEPGQESSMLLLQLEPRAIWAWIWRTWTKKKRRR